MLASSTVAGEGARMGTVMVVDDDERIRTLLARALSTDGHAVVEAADGLAALTQLEHTLVDIVLLDLIMPRCDGYTVLSVLRQRRDLTPVIVMSGIPDIDGAVTPATAPDTQ